MTICKQHPVQWPLKFLPDAQHNLGIKSTLLNDRFCRLATFDPLTPIVMIIKENPLFIYCYYSPPETKILCVYEQLFADCHPFLSCSSVSSLGISWERIFARPSWCRWHATVPFENPRSDDKRRVLDPGCCSTCWHKISLLNVLSLTDLDLSLGLMSPSLNRHNHSVVWDLEMNHWPSMSLISSAVALALKPFFPIKL